MLCSILNVDGQGMDYQKPGAGRCWLLATWLLWLAVPAMAAQALFEAELPVSSQGRAVRTEAFRQALSEVLVRVTGEQSVPGSEAAKPLLESPERLVQQYRYFTEQDGPSPALMLWVRFDGDAIRRALRQQGQSWWGGERPDMLVWLAVEDHGRRYIVSSDGISDVHAQISRAAKQRGVPILFPLMDLEDQSRVRHSDLWGGYFDKVMAASERYRPPAVLIGRLNRSPSGGWTSRWRLDMAGQVNEWNDTHQELDALSRRGIEDVADLLASRFAVGGNGGAGHAVIITVTDVETLAAYARINRYLETLTQVNRLQVTQVTPDAVSYALQLNGNLQDLTRIVSIGTVLEPVAGGVSGQFRLRR